MVRGHAGRGLLICRLHIPSMAHFVRGRRAEWTQSGQARYTIRRFPRLQLIRFVDKLCSFSSVGFALLGVVDVMQRVTFAMPPKPVPAPTSMWAFDADNFDGDPLRRVTTMECGPFAPKEDPEHDDFAPPSDAHSE